MLRGPRVFQEDTPQPPDVPPDPNRGQSRVQASLPGPLRSLGAPHDPGRLRAHTPRPPGVRGDPSADRPPEPRWVLAQVGLDDQGQTQAQEREAPGFTAGELLGVGPAGPEQAKPWHLRGPCAFPHPAPHDRIHGRAPRPAQVQAWGCRERGGCVAPSLRPAAPLLPAKAPGQG